MLSSRAITLRIVHGLLSLYFTLCLLYVYFAAITRHYDVSLAICIVSLALEGIAVYVLNGGNCPLIHIQKRFGDDKPFFEIFFPPWLAQLAIPVFSVVTLAGLVLLMIRYAL